MQNGGDLATGLWWGEVYLKEQTSLMGSETTSVSWHEGAGRRGVP